MRVALGQLRDDRVNQGNEFKCGLVHIKFLELKIHVSPSCGVVSVVIGKGVGGVACRTVQGVHPALNSGNDARA